MSVMFNNFPSKTSPLLTSSQKIFIRGVPVVILHSFVTCVPSMTVTFWTCSTEGGSTENKFQDVTWCRYSFLSKTQNRKKKSYSFEHNSFQFSIMKTYLNTLLINASRSEKEGSFWIEDFDRVEVINASISDLVERLSIEIFSTNKTQNSNFSNPFCCDLPFRFPLTFSLFIINFF